MGIWEREDSRITLGFLVPVTLWPMVPYLETQNTAEDTGLEQRRGKRWRWERKGNGLKGTLDPNCAVQFETCWNWGTYRTSNEMSNTNGSRGLEFRREVHGCGYRPRVRENFPEEARDELRTQEWLRARWRGRGRVSGSRDCLHSDLDPKAWEKWLLLWLSDLHSEDLTFILKTVKKTEIPAKRSAPTSACIYCESPGGLAERERGQGTRDPAAATKQKLAVFSCQPWAAKQQTQAKKRAKALPRMNFLWNITDEKQNPLNLVTAPGGIKRFLWNYSQISKTIIRITKWIDQNSIEKIFTQAKPPRFNSSFN